MQVFTLDHVSDRGWHVPQCGLDLRGSIVVQLLGLGQGLIELAFLRKFGLPQSDLLKALFSYCTFKQLPRSTFAGAVAGENPERCLFQVFSNRFLRYAIGVVRVRTACKSTGDGCIGRGVNTYDLPRGRLPVL